MTTDFNIKNNNYELNKNLMDSETPNENNVARQSDTNKDKDIPNKYIYFDNRGHTGGRMEKEKVNTPGETISEVRPKLSPFDIQRFNALTKIGIYKELYKKNMLTEMQLSQLLQMQDDVSNVMVEAPNAEHDAQHKRKKEPMEM